MVGRRPEPLAETASTLEGAATVAADLRDPSAAASVLAAVGEREVAAIVNNAGGYLGRADDELPTIAQQWRDTFDTNVLTAVVLTEALLPRLARPGGRVILFSSIAAQRGGGGPYSAAKAALHGWALDLAVQLGPEGVTANVISPGFVEDTEFFAGRMTEQGYASRVGATLVGRAGKPDEIAQTVRWLVGPSGGYVTGQIINVNGGSVLGR
ncbi:3-oxoacyl-ACP reductase [Rhizocola hellebori]|uniref:3-oxoacyl-ACP reductase n=1 Tax=Rhizocola hellebori TaxID=1392758 RepID=A0A8J3VGK8_9ACTN|nr:3-oxoacyl-ACP reductase [Rhizocola hellebori]